MDRIDCLRAFVRSLEGGSFSVAANELGIGQPAVSKRIALLESEFGTQLFFRTTRKLKPTPEGHRIYDLARQILGNFDLARANVEESSLRPSGTLRVSLPSSFGRRYLMPVIAEYVRTYQGVRLDVRFSERFVNLVEEGIELALRIGQLESSTLVARRLGTVRRYLVATPTYLKGRSVPRAPEDLNAHQCIVYSRVPAANDWIFESEHGRHVASIGGTAAGRRCRRDGTGGDASSRHRRPAGMERRRRHSQRPVAEPAAGFFDRRPAAARGLSRNALDVAAGAQLPRPADQARGAILYAVSYRRPCERRTHTPRPSR